MLSFNNSAHVKCNPHHSSTRRYQPANAPLNADCARQALRLLLDSLMTDENCKRFRAFPEGYCRDFGLSLEQIHAITDLDIVRLLKLGGTTSELERLTSLYGLDLKELCADQSGKSLEEVQQQLACE